MTFKGFAFKASAIAMSSAFLLAGCSHGVAQGPSFLPQSQPFAPSGFLRPNTTGTPVKSIEWGKLPAATAGKAFKKPVAVTITAKGSNGKAITGPYAKPIKLTDSDKTGATVLQINGKPASGKNTLNSSTDNVTLKYTGLAIKPAKFNASSKGAKAGKATFSPCAGRHRVLRSESLVGGGDRSDEFDAEHGRVFRRVYGDASRLDGLVQETF